MIVSILFSIFILLKFEIRMKLPVFYKPDINSNEKDVLLDEPTSKHVVQVLRMLAGEQLQLTDGKGNLFTTEIIDDNRKKCRVSILQQLEIPQPQSKITIAISPVKNNTRFEWFLEKATEIGVAEIVPIICERTEKQHFKWERMNSILVSAMLQSQQCWLPKLSQPVLFKDLLTQRLSSQKFIAHCEESNEKVALTSMHPFNESIIIIGPEGDFSKAEITSALTCNFIPVTLGDTRLRTETAGIVAATLLCIH